jgi:hypothetical protein
MSPSKGPAASKNAKQRKRLSLNKKTVKDLSAQGQGPGGGARLSPARCSKITSGCL